MAPHQSYIAPSVQLIQLSTHLSFKAWTSLSLLNGPACQAPLSNRRSYLNLSSGESLRRVLTRSDGSEASAHCFMNWKKSLEKYSCTHSFHNRHDGEHTPSVRVPVSQTSLAAEPAKWLRTLLLWIWNFQPKKVPSLRRAIARQVWTSSYNSPIGEAFPTATFCLIVVLIFAVLFRIPTTHCIR